MGKDKQEQEKRLEQRLSTGVTFDQQFYAAILKELRLIRKALIPDEAASETVKLREAEDKE